MTQVRKKPATTDSRRDTVNGLEAAHVLEPPQVELEVVALLRHRRELAVPAPIEEDQ